MTDFKIDAAFVEMADELIKMRRHFHMDPELYYNERNTADFIARYLTELGFEVRTQVAKTGVVGLWKGETSSDNPRVLALRADMDALPIDEENDVEYKSKNAGKMHACGHDGHMSILLGFAKWLANRAEPFPGHVKLLFQPAEEGYGGAKKMLDEGALLAPEVEQIIGLHLWNDMEVGVVGVTAGPAMASVDGFEINIKGKGGHSAMPHQAVDAVLVAAQITVALQTIVSRNVDPLTPSVLTVSKIEAGTADNAIAETAKLRGVVRAFDSGVRDLWPERIDRIARGVADAFGATMSFHWTPMYPPMVSDGETTALVKTAATEIVGQKRIVENQRTMASEDMAYFLEEVPGCFFFLGSANSEKGLNFPHHNPRFDFDEAVLPLGTAILARCAELFFQGKPHPGLG